MGSRQSEGLQGIQVDREEVIMQMMIEVVGLRRKVAKHIFVFVGNPDGMKAVHQLFFLSKIRISERSV